MKILVLNAGSSSQKSCLYELAGDALPEQPPEPLWTAQIDWSHRSDLAELKVKTAQGAALTTELPLESRASVMEQLLQTLWSGSTQVIAAPTEINVVGHRVVHGGQEYRESTQITPDVKATIARLAVLAPAHNPANLEGIEAVEQSLGTVPQVAVFDTAFHSQMPLQAVVYPIAYEWFERGLRRYGFHGISHQYVATRTAQLLGKPLDGLRLITCHLGNGCSLAAIAQGRSIDTSMGFTPLEGLMMGTRSGSVDPGLLIHLLQQHHLDAQQLDDLLNRQSGLKGVSGVSGDMRQILAAIAQGNSRAKLALEVYVYRLRAQISALLPALGGLDALVFTGGVGENSEVVRAGVCEGLNWLGVQLNSAQNLSHPVDQDIATPDSAARVLVVHTQEDWAIAQECWRLGDRSA